VIAQVTALVPGDYFAPYLMGKFVGGTLNAILSADFFHDLHHSIVKISTYQQCIFLFKINPDAINFDLLDGNEGIKGT